MEIVNQSSSMVGLPARSDVDRGGSRAKSAATSESREAFAAPATRESKSTRRMLESGYVASISGTTTTRSTLRMRHHITVTTRKGRHKTLGLRATGGWQHLGCSGPSIQDLFVVHRVGVGVAQPEGGQGSSSNGRANSLVELEEPEPRQHVRGVVGQSECSQQILDVRGLHEPQTPILDIRNSSTPKLEFEQIRMVCGAHQHCLLFERHAFLSVRKDCSQTAATCASSSAQVTRRGRIPA